MYFLQNNLSNFDSNIYGSLSGTAFDKVGRENEVYFPVIVSICNVLRFQKAANNSVGKGIFSVFL